MTSFPIHVAGLVVVIAAILFYCVASIFCLIIWSIVSLEKRNLKEWFRALSLSGLILTALHLVGSPLLILFFAGLYASLFGGASGRDFEKNKNLYDEYLLYVWMGLTLIVWFVIAKARHNVRMMNSSA